ncbi:MAG: hypothetical protein LBM21_03270 [Coriobacteriales bacterium]|jgi:riboflavin kinase/FMN adenylyltransferase|nr:hypothetical protein [Coriobacteriales bacterium]
MEKTSQERPPIIYWPKDCKSKPAATLAIGVFDGVHEGHQYLIGECVKDAQKRKCEAWVVTFNIDPDELFGTPHKLLTNEHRLKLLSMQDGIDGVLVLPFDRKLAGLSPNEFLDEVIAHAFTPVSIHVGTNFRFGARAAGDDETLRRWGLSQKPVCDVYIHELFSEDGKPVSSTRIRKLISSGDMTHAEHMLTRPYVHEEDTL